VCNPTVSGVQHFEIDYTGNYKLHNWVESYCEDKYRVGLIGSLFFLGYALSSILLAPISSKWGRKKVLIWSSGIQILLFSGVCFTSSLLLLYILILGIGLA